MKVDDHNKRMRALGATFTQIRKSISVMLKVEV